MKETPQDRELAANLHSGFLGSDSRDIWEIIASDRAAIEKLGWTNEHVSQCLGNILSLAMPQPGNPVQVGDNLTAVYHEGMGRIPCPWPHCILAPKGEIVVTDGDGKTLKFSPLSVHLIDEHGFYQGHGSRYRLEPADLAGSGLLFDVK